MASASLTEGPIGKHLYVMALPMVIGLLGNMSIQVVDIWFISMLGDDALAAMGFVFPVALIYLSIAIGLSAGTSSVVARKIPDGDKQGLKRLVTDAQSLCFLLAVIASIIGWLTIEPLFTLMGASAVLMPLIKDYIIIFYGSAFFTMLGMCALSTVRATGNAKLQGQAMLLSAVINAVLDPILIFGLFGAPRLEIQGAALASLIARFFTFLIGYLYLSGKMHLLTTPFVAVAEVLRSWKQVLHVGLPAMGTNIIIPVSSAIITALLATYGKDAVAGMGVAGRIEPLMLIAYYALSAVIGPFVGQNLMAGKNDRVLHGVKRACQFTMGLGFLTAILLWVLAPTVATWFTSTPSVIQVAVDYLWIVPVSYGCAGVVMIVNASFNGIGRPLPATTVSLLRVIIIYLPFAWLGSYLFGVKGIFVAYALVNILCALIAYTWFIRLINVEQAKAVESRP